MNFASVFSNINSKEVLKHLPDAVLIVETDGKISWVNYKAVDIFEADSRFLKEIYINEIIADGFEMIKNSINSKSSTATAAFTPDHKEIFIEINAKKFGEQYFVTVRDITSLTAILETAEKTGRLNKEKNTMLVKLSNEIKSPLQSITGFSQALLEGLGGGELNEKQDKYLKIINKSSGELLTFMDKLLEFSQAESTLYKTEYHIFDVVNTTQNIIKDNQNILFAKKLSLEFDSEELSKKAIYSDEKLIKTIIQNLIENAVKMTETGSITIKLKYPDIDLLNKKLAVSNDISENQYLLISVNDTGIGLSELEMRNIFEPYSQLDKTNKKGILRSINLGTVNTLVKKLQGVVWVESGVMKGSTYHVILPIDKDIILTEDIMG